MSVLPPVATAVLLSSLFISLHPSLRLHSAGWTPSYGGVSDKMLTQHLKEMKSDRIVTRTDYREVPPRVDYNLTALAHSPSEALVPLCSWGTENMVEVTRVLAERVTWSSSAN